MCAQTTRLSDRQLKAIKRKTGITSSRMATGAPRNVMTCFKYSF